MCQFCSLDNVQYGFAFAHSAYSNARAATAAPIAPMFEPSTWAAPDGVVADVELDGFVDVGNPKSLPIVSQGHRGMTDFEFHW